MVKRIYFFKDGLCFQYDPRPGTDRVIKPPTPIGTRFKDLNATFAARIDAAVNWGDGFVYLFNGDEYWKYDALRDRTDTPAPRKIAEGCPTFPPAFAPGIDAAFNSGEDKAYFFKGHQYLRSNIGSDAVDTPDPGTSAYPRKAPIRMGGGVYPRRSTPAEMPPRMPTTERSTSSGEPSACG